MTSPSEQSAQYEDEIDLRDIFRVLWRRKWLIVSVTFAFAAISVIIALNIPNQYRAEATVAPNSSGSPSELGALAAQYGALAGLAGISFGSNSSDKTTLGLEVMKSRRFISDFIERHGALVPLMAAKGWDASSGNMIIDSDIYDVEKQKWTRRARLPRTVQPSAQEAYEEFIDRFSVIQDDRSGFIKISFEHYSPVVARDWIAWIIEDLNDTIRHQDVKKAEQVIEYLDAQIEKTSLAGLQSVFFNLIEEQTKIIMLASVSSEYLFMTIDPPVAPEEKSSPSRALLALLGAMIGGLVASLFALIQGDRLS